MFILVFVSSFIVCGLICVLAQLLINAFKVTPPVILNLFLAVGGLLTPCGFMAWLDSVGSGGMLVAICGAGNAFETAGELLVAGMPSMLITILALFAVTTLLGMATGEIRHRYENAHQTRQTHQVSSTENKAAQPNS